MSTKLLSLRLRAKSLGERAARVPVLGPIGFDLGAREIVALTGPSGSGKTTLLRILGGLDTDFTGELEWRDGSPPRIGTVFQEPRLLPWRTVQQNLDLAAGRAGAGGEVLAALGLSAHRHHYPRALSLGLARRAAIARAFAIEPALVLLDEPFVSLDEASAEQARAVLLDVWRRLSCALLIVTHDLAEAAALADRILLLSGRPARLTAEVVIPERQRRQGIATGARVIAALRAEGRL